MRLFVFGAGYSGRAIAREALAGGAAVAGTTRSPGKAEELRAEGMTPFLFDGSSLSGEIEAGLAAATHLVCSAAPDPADPVLAAARDVVAVKMPALRWIGYLSTIGVYGDHGGAWVDEETPCLPASRRAQLRAAAEEEWLALGARAGIAVAVLRLGGIYGPGRNGFVGLAEGTARRIVKPGQVFNRIHVDDISGAALLLAGHCRGGIFNAVDDEPAPPQDVVAHAAALMGVEPPPETPFEAAAMTAMARSFYDDNKRVSNGRLKAEGYRFRFPDYRAGLLHLWGSGTWRH